MNRREALAALMSLPQIARVQKADLKPNDVIVVECDGDLSTDMVKRMEAQLLSVWPGRKVLVLSGGLHMKVVLGDEEIS